MSCLLRWAALGVACCAGVRPVAAQGPAPATVLPALPHTARSEGLHGASVAMIGYAGSVFRNPAGIAPVRVMSLEGGYTRLSDSSSYVLGAAAIRLGELNFGGGIRYLRFDAGGSEDSQLESVFSVVTRVKGVALGVSADYFSVESAAGAVRRTATTDAAITVAVFDIAALAFSVQNIGRLGFGDPVLDLPSSVHLGFSLNLIDTYSNGRLLAVIEQSWVEGDGQFAFGLEAGVVLYGLGVMARGGIGGRPGDSPYEGVTWGGSLVLGRALLDYTYLHRRSQGPLHLFGFRLTP